MRGTPAVDNLSRTDIDGRARDCDSIAQHVDQAPSEELACFSALAGMFHVKH